MLLLTVIYYLLYAKCPEHVARMGERRDAYRVVVERPEGRRPLGRRRCRWKDNIKEVGKEGIDWIDLAQNRERRRALVNVLMNFPVP